jgi:hypothetical protein
VLAFVLRNIESDFVNGRFIDPRMLILTFLLSAFIVHGELGELPGAVAPGAHLDAFN